MRFASSPNTLQVRHRDTVLEPYYTMALRHGVTSTLLCARNIEASVSYSQLINLPTVGVPV